jgi:hypothetical protein
VAGFPLSAAILRFPRAGEKVFAFNRSQYGYSSTASTTSRAMPKRTIDPCISSQVPGKP